MFVVFTCPNGNKYATSSNADAFYSHGTKDKTKAATFTKADADYLALCIQHIYAVQCYVAKV